jgi:hypothetical protein
MGTGEYGGVMGGWGAKPGMVGREQASGMRMGHRRGEMAWDGALVGADGGAWR